MNFNFISFFFFDKKIYITIFLHTKVCFYFRVYDKKLKIIKLSERNVEIEF